MKKCKTKILCCILALCTMCGMMCLHNTLQIAYADSAVASVILEKNSGRVLYENNAHKQLANASTTKIATFLTVLKNVEDYNTKFEVDSRSVGIEGTSIYLRKGEKLCVKELLFGMMLPSGNDAATALALHICDSVDEFGKLMTKEANSIGAKNSCFKNPHGLDQKGHYTTAYDLALIASECLNYEIFREVVTTKNTTIPSSTGEGFRYLKSKNKLLTTFDGCTGIKTGYTSNAGRCLVSSAQRDGMHLVSVVLNCRPMFEESATRMEEMFEKYKMTEIVAPYSYLQDIEILNSKTKTVKVFNKKGFCYPLTEKEQNNINVEVVLDKNIAAPLKKEESVGKIEIYFLKDLIFCEKIYTMEGVKSDKIDCNISKIVKKWLFK